MRISVAPVQNGITLFNLVRFLADHKAPANLETRAHLLARYNGNAAGYSLRVPVIVANNLLAPDAADFLRVENALTEARETLA